MRKLNLVQPDGTIDPLASVRLIALMAFPKEPKARYRFVKEAREKGTVPLERVRHNFEVGISVGDLILYFLQDHQHSSEDSTGREGRKSASLNDVLPLVAAAIFEDRFLPLEGLGPLDRRADLGADREKLGSRRVGRVALLNDFHRFRPVAHFWTAWVCWSAYANKNLDCVDFLSSGTKGKKIEDEVRIERLARFVATSHSILNLAEPIFFSARPRGRSPRREPLLLNPWKIKLPTTVEKPEPKIKLPQIHPKAEALRRKVRGTS